MKGQFGSFLRCEGGQISIEFAILMPLYAFVLVGSFEFWDAFRSSSQTAKVAYAASDIASRVNTFNDDEAQRIADVVDKMLGVDLDQRRLRISNICFEDNRYAVQWSAPYTTVDVTEPFEPITDDDLLTADGDPLPFLPTMAPQESIILVELIARWRPAFNVGIGAQTWRFELVTRPRFVENSVPYEGVNDTDFCPNAV
ncbi:MAG: TadE/TadG family type IV pilus assembly protein [Pseudomonadota bacterium]